MNNFNNEIKLILQQYLEKFEAHYERVLQDDQYIEALETLMDDYSEFILNPIYEQQFNAWRDVEEKAQLMLYQNHSYFPKLNFEFLVYRLLAVKIDVVHQKASYLLFYICDSIVAHAQMLQPNVEFQLLLV